jgi:hypothetical protein
MKLQEDIQDIEVIIKFNAALNNKYTWCNNIELFINYDMLQSGGFRFS